MDISKYKELFLSECKEKLDAMEKLALALEKEPKNQEVINAIFRDAHSVKGMASTMGYQNISKLSHRLENLFDKARKTELSVDSDVINVILKTVAVLSEMLVAVGEKNSDDTAGMKVIDELESIIKGEGRPSGGDVPKVDLRGPVMALKDPFVRVRAKHLDRLIDIISEFMSLKWRFEKFARNREVMELSDDIEAFKKLNRDLNEKILSMRMMPVGVLTAKLPKLTRDMGRELGKSVSLECGGESIELDKNVIESLEAPVIHMIRNCIDHGLESEEERKAIGKSPTGNVFFKAHRLGDRVIIEIGDDGRGIDFERVAKKVVDAGIVKEGDLESMDPEARLLLICAPGVSTLDEVSEVSGRGVGMDVVKSSIESLGGALAVFSAKGVGTTFRIDLPLTAAIIKVFVVEVGGIAYGIPLSEVARVAEIDSLEYIVEKGVVYYEPGDGSLGRMQLFQLGEVLSLDPSTETSNVQKVLVVKFGEDAIAVEVDGLCGVEEVVIKPLTVVLKYVRGISAVTVLPTGKPMLVLNVKELFA